MKERFQLSTKEKILQSFLRFILLLVLIIICKGIYNQNNNINEDNILFPTFLIVSEIFCILYSLNAFSSGNLVRNWAGSFTFYKLFTYYTNKGLNEDNASKKTIRFFGQFTLIIAIILPLLAIMFYKKILIF